MKRPAQTALTGSEPLLLPSPPQADQIVVRRQLHGVELEDPFYWLRERDDPAVIAHLETENAHTEQAMAHTAELRERLYQEMVARIEEDDASVPVKDGEYFYYQRTGQGLQYPIYCRRHGEQGDEEILLDLNRLAESRSYLRLGVLEVSPDHRLLAYSLDEDGSETFTLHLLDLETGELLTDVLHNTARSLVWTNDNRGFYYSILDQQRRPFAARFHRLGTAVEDDEEIYREDDERFFLGLAKTRSRRFVMLEVGSHTTTEVRYLDLEDPEPGFRLFAPRQQGVEVTVDHHGDHFYVLTNEGARNFRLIRTPVDDPRPERWQEIVGHREDVKLDSLELSRHHLALFLRQGGQRAIRILDLGSGVWHSIQLDEPVFAVWPQETREFDSPVLRYLFTSLVTPRSVYEYDMTSRRKTLLKRYRVLGGYDPSHYLCERRFVTTADGARVPVSLVRRRDTPLDGSAPALLYGYGAYGNCIEPYFSSLRLSLLDRGFVYGIAHVRGGGEMGRPWYDDGKLERKPNTFGDFVAVAEMLVEERYTSHDRLAIRGGSAGGMLVGAVLNLRPDLMRAAIAEVPFVDVLNSMLDPNLPLTVIEYEEWGNPEEPEAFETIRSYSPYDNLAAVEYPHMLVTAGLNDPRVQYWEPAKWVAKLRLLKTDDRRQLLRTNMDSGHGGASGRYDALREEAFKMAFLIDVLEASTEPLAWHPSAS